MDTAAQILRGLLEQQRDKIPAGDEEFAVFTGDWDNIRILDRGFTTQGAAENQVRSTWMHYYPGAFAQQICPDHRFTEPADQATPRGDCTLPHDF